MIQLTKDNTASPAVYSSQTGLVPIRFAITTDGSNSPATIAAVSETPAYVH